MKWASPGTSAGSPPPTGSIVDGDKKPEVFTPGDAANLLTPTIGDANTMIPESKAFMVNVVKKGVK